MKHTIHFLFVLFVLIFSILQSAQAQTDLEIRHAFDRYAKAKGATMVELSKSALEEYNFTFFKSLTVTDNAQAGDFIRACLQKDEVAAKKVKQVITNGKVASIYLILPPKKNIHRLILFKESAQLNKEITLIYIESEVDSEDVLKLILKKNNP